MSEALSPRIEVQLKEPFFLFRRAVAVQQRRCPYRSYQVVIDLQHLRSDGFLFFPGITDAVAEAQKLSSERRLLSEPEPCTLADCITIVAIDWFNKNGVPGTLLLDLLWLLL